MRVKTILNRIQKFKSFVYSAVLWMEGLDGEVAIEAELRPPADARPRCSISVAWRVRCDRVQRA
jgi:transposase